jgi:hypothetical protein
MELIVESVRLKKEKLSEREFHDLLAAYSGHGWGTTDTSIWQSKTRQFVLGLSHDQEYGL